MKPKGNIMTIGELLKQFRIKNLKTQKEWASGIVSPSYYAKVEKGLHRITAEDLLAILTANQIKPEDFFNKLSANQEHDNAASFIDREVNRAYYQNNPAKIRKIRQYVADSDFKDKDKEKILLLIDFELADVENKLADLSETKKNKLKSWLFDQNDFDERALRIYINLIPIYDLKSNLLIGKKIVEKLKNVSKPRQQEELLDVICNILIMCIEQKSYTEAQYFITAAEKVKMIPELFFCKNMLVLLENMVNYHFVHKPEYISKCKWAIKNFTLLGMPEYGEQAELFVNENLNK